MAVVIEEEQRPPPQPNVPDRPFFTDPQRVRRRRAMIERMRAGH